MHICYLLVLDVGYGFLNSLLMERLICCWNATMLTYSHSTLSFAYAYAYKNSLRWSQCPEGAGISMSYLFHRIKTLYPILVICTCSH